MWSLTQARFTSFKSCPSILTHPGYKYINIENQSFYNPTRLRTGEICFPVKANYFNLNFLTKNIPVIVPSSSLGTWMMTGNTNRQDIWRSNKVRGTYPYTNITKQNFKWKKNYNNLFFENMKILKSGSGYLWASWIQVDKIYLSQDQDISELDGYKWINYTWVRISQDIYRLDGYRWIKYTWAESGSVRISID